MHESTDKYVADETAKHTSGCAYSYSMYTVRAPHLFFSLGITWSIVTCVTHIETFPFHADILHAYIHYVVQCY